MSHTEHVRSLRSHRDAPPPPLSAARIADVSLTVEPAQLITQSKFTVADARKCSTTSFGRLHKTKVAWASPRGTSLTHPDVSRIPTPPNHCSSNAQSEHPSPRQQQLHKPRSPTHQPHRRNAVSVSSRGDVFFEEDDSGDDLEGAPLFSLVPGLSSSSQTPETSLTQEPQEDPWQHLRRPFREDLDEGQQRNVLQELREERYKLWLERSKVGPHALRRWTRRQQGFVLASLVVEAHAYHRLQKEKQRAPQAQRTPTIPEPPPRPSNSARSIEANSSGTRSLRTPEDNPLNYAVSQVDVVLNPVPPPTRDMMPPPIQRPNVNLGDRQTSAFLVHDIFVLVVDQPPQGGDANQPYDDVRVQLQSLYLWYVEK